MLIDLRELDGHVMLVTFFTKNGILKKKVRSKNDINYMTYLLDILRAGGSNESGVFTFWEKNMGKINVVMYVTSVSFPKNRGQAEIFYNKV